MVRKKVLIVGPFAKSGGREVEVSLISAFLSKRFDLEVLTTGNFFEDSDVVTFINKDYFTGIDKILVNTFPINIFMGLISFIKKSKTPKHQRISNKFLKLFLNLKKRRLRILKSKINKNDVIFICAQPSSNLIDSIIEYSYIKNKVVLFRTTGTILETHKNIYESLKKVTTFIHHSTDNKLNFDKYYFKHKFETIDQCSGIENELLQLKIKQKTKIRNFLILSRLTKDKGILDVIKVFSDIRDDNINLKIFGSGPLECVIKQLASKDERISFEGHVAHKNVAKAFENIDCLIISSVFETGPLTGIEAMAAGKLILSTKVGAMHDRLGNQSFWYDGTSKDLYNKLLNIISLKTDLYDLQKKNREKYLKNLSFKIIEKKYIDLVLEVSKQNN